MSRLPSVDLGLMAEHLTAHEGVLNKLHYYESLATLPKLKEILALQNSIMQSHVDVMLKFMDPQFNQPVTVPPISVYQDITLNNIQYSDDYTNKWITLEAHNTARSMANTNYVSALMMKDPDVKNAHIEMSLQQTNIQEQYANLISMMNWSFVPHSSLKNQLQTYQFYNDVFN
ncbi:hypothetical protein [Aquisalibacillus elongatus]|uniref:Coat F domain-containing protein n=1 Tax=Aquisalibacillus elongatus TaxID=485577 RepID=A0A3N5C2I5_9BACI|nr:hypothetical protein [Aquisalibacillus elongatus]RPF50381.1 hypothetical protein EDC24_2819 [Aquisalibacillus elongatus]